MYNPYYETFEEPEAPSCECGAIHGQACEPDCERITPERDDLNALAMSYALDMVHTSLAAARDMDWERERDYHAEELALEAKRPRKEVA